MSQISQNMDGTYSKSYSDVEIMLIKNMQLEATTRAENDNLLYLDLTGVKNNVETLMNDRFSMTELQSSIGKNLLLIEEQEGRLSKLESISIQASYTKEEIDQYMVSWKVEAIQHVPDTPTNAMFDEADWDRIQTGFHHYYAANINEPFDNHFRENTMIRYSIYAYAAIPKSAEFTIFYADRLSIYVNDVLHEAYIDAGGNFSGAAKVTSVPLNEGWTKIQFLISNDTQGGGLVFTSNLHEQADYLTSMGYFGGKVTGRMIQSGTLESHHFSPNMDLVVHTVHATATEVPGLVAGDPSDKGSVQIGDGVITKSKDEPFHFNDSISVDGYIRVTQLLIDRDFIRAGSGIVVNTYKDDYGYTNMYEIVNDMKLTASGLKIEGNARDGYRIINDLTLFADENAGVRVDGNASDGYSITNTMRLTAEPPGLVTVEGNAADGYNLVTRLAIKAGGGIRVGGDFDTGEVTITNDMKLKGLGSVKVTGNAENGYTVDGAWPTLEAGKGIAITSRTPGTYKIDNTGVLSLEPGDGIRVVDDGQGNYTIDNDGVNNITGGDHVTVTDDNNGNYHIEVDIPEYVEPDFEETVIYGVDKVDAVKKNGAWYISADIPDVTEFETTNIVGLNPVTSEFKNGTWYISSKTEPPTQTEIHNNWDMYSEYILNLQYGIVAPPIADNIAAGYYEARTGNQALIGFVRFRPTDQVPKIRVTFKGGLQAGGTVVMRFQTTTDPDAGVQYVLEDVNLSAYGQVTHTDGAAGFIAYEYLAPSHHFGKTLLIRVWIKKLGARVKYWKTERIAKTT